MIDLGFGKKKTPDTPAAGASVKDVTDQSFMADVIEASRQTPIIVDFWAPWCGPCKTLGPQLEAAVAATKGQVQMVKVNVDENQMVASQLRVQSIPAVFAFVDGQPVDGFMGAITPAEVKRFVEEVAKMGAGGAGGQGGNIEQALAAAEEMLAKGQTAEAAQTFAAIRQADPANASAIAGLVKALIALGDTAAAKEAVAEAPGEIQGDPAIAAARSAIELSEMAAGAGEAGQLRARLEANPDDHQARYDLALALLGAGDKEGAIDQLLDLFRRDREWNEGAAKAQLFKVFESLGSKDPLAQKGRRRLSSMIFA